MNNTGLIDVLYHSEVRVPIKSRQFIRNPHGLKAGYSYFNLACCNDTCRLLDIAACSRLVARLSLDCSLSYVNVLPI